MDLGFQTTKQLYETENSRIETTTKWEKNNERRKESKRDEEEKYPWEHYLWRRGKPKKYRAMETE
ncbi:hypothetical protein SESBI_00895 [Sesbania bispinosa]|nr:hypothetical protein SESBI_00895 [Sesbania bispinosa]